MGQHYSQMELPKCSGFRQIKSLPCTAVEYAVDSFPPHKGQEPDPHRMPPRFNAIAASVPSISQSSTIPSGGFLVGMIFLACFLLIFSAVLTGLTLAVCGLDKSLVDLRCISGTPKERSQAAVVAQLKRHGSWMLCALIVCTCACAETFPFVLQEVYHGQRLWLLIVISTLIFGFIAEILPQYFFPRHAISCGYWCWPLIWGCMILTSPVSWPISRVLDKIWDKTTDFGVFTNKELEHVIKYHERSEKHGGQLGQDATRVMTGALKLDSRTIAMETVKTVELPDDEGSEKDVEKAVVIVQGMLVKWSTVNTVDIDEEVNEAFIRKIKGWSYSRIPVISKPEIGFWSGKMKNGEDYDAFRVYGFLHIKNLIGLDSKASKTPDNGLRVRDLPLYPLPIVREAMPIYDLFNLFQLGMSRMAIVLSNSATYDPLGPSPPTVFHDPADFNTIRWTASKRTNEKIMSKLAGNGKKLDWNSEFLATARSNATEKGLEQQIHGVRCPKPLGIITFEDILDTMIQKTTRDEKDFFDRDCTTPPTKSKKPGDEILKLSTSLYRRNEENPAPTSVPRTRMSPPAKPKSLRQRTNSKRVKIVAGYDGPADNSSETAIESPPKARLRSSHSESSYTQNSKGGFHSQGSGSTMIGGARMSSIELAELKASAFGNPFSHATLPSRKSPLVDLKNPQSSQRHVSASQQVLPTLRHVTPFSRSNTLSFEKAQKEIDETKFIMPEPSTESPLISTKDEALTTTKPVEDEKIPKRRERTEDSCETVTTLSSWIHGYYEHHQPQDPLNTNETMPFSMERMLNEATDIFNNLDAIVEKSSKECIDEKSLKGCVEHAPEKRRAYSGFPEDLLENTSENRVPNYTSLTLPKLPISIEFEKFIDNINGDSPGFIRERSFEDGDVRKSLPSQRKSLENTFGTRSLSGLF